MANMIPEYRKLHLVSIDNKKYPNDTKDDVITEILSYPAVLLRGHRDELIVWNKNTSEPKLIWIEEMINSMSETDLRTLRSFIIRRYENQTKTY